MTEQTNDETLYVVQMLIEIGGSAGDGPLFGWRDIATVKVPSGSQRKTVYAAALKAAGIAPQVGGAPLELRALDQKSALSQKIGAKPRDPELEFS